MVKFAPFLTSALFAALVAAAPMPDSAIGNEVAVSAPNGTPMSDTATPSATGSSGGSGSSYGGSSGGSYGGSSGSSYGGSSGGCSGSSCDSNKGDKSSMGDKSSKGSKGDSSSMMSDSSTKMSDSSSTMMDASTSTSSAYNSYSTPSYGSGGSNWGGSGYDNCVQQCMASYGGNMGSYMPTATYSGGSSGSGATHTVIVAPSQGVLRYVPFAVNASVGDTVMFMWGANNHTVTKSSALEPCNKTSDALFASGTQNKDFMFAQVVNDTNPVFFYCATPGHCAKGMFGVINPPSVDNNANTSAAMMMSSMMMNNSDMSAMASYTQMKTMNNSAASSWGMSMDMSKVPDWAQQSMAENIMYTQTFLASNPEVLNSDGTVDMSKIGASGNPAMVPMDVTQALNNAGSSSSSSTPASATASASAGSSSASSSATPAGAAKTNGARSLGSSGALVAAVAVLATVLAL